VIKEQEQTKCQISRQKEIIKIRAGIKEMRLKITIQRVNETKSLFFEKKNNIKNKREREREKRDPN
jgi:hypothetical protein